jgi:hypothetical protein
MLFIKPRYETLRATKTQNQTYDASLATADKLKRSRDDLVARYNNISKEDLDNLKALLPDSVDNIRLIIQIDSLATKNGMSSLRNVDYKSDADVVNANPGSGTTATSAVGASASALDISKRPYGEFIITFQTSGQYSNFLAFLADLERNLRLVDVTAITFTNADTANTAGGIAVNMNYKVTLKTYWLKQ